MPMNDFQGKTYVAFLDISGFTATMERSIKHAGKILDKFYNAIFSVENYFEQQNHRQAVEVNEIAVSDCAVIFPSNRQYRCSDVDKMGGLKRLLEFIREVNLRLICSKPFVTTTCSIAYGEFKYEKRFELQNLSKDYFVGWSYLKAYYDNEKGRRDHQGQCRLLKENLGEFSKPRNKNTPFSLLKGTRKYYYFYWMLKSIGELRRFREEQEGAVTYWEKDQILHRYACAAR